MKHVNKFFRIWKIQIMICNLHTHTHTHTQIHFGFNSSLLEKKTFSMAPVPPITSKKTLKKKSKLLILTL